MSKPWESPGLSRGGAVNAKITDLGAVRAARARPINQACRWNEALETVMTANLRAACVLQRMWLRAWGVC